jgi:hypothetical protein
MESCRDTKIRILPDQANKSQLKVSDWSYLRNTILTAEHSNGCKYLIKFLVYAKHY